MEYYYSNCKCKIVLILIFFEVSVFGATQIKSNPPIYIEAADQQEFDGAVYSASGNVEIHWETYRLFSDYFEFDINTRQLKARGRVTLISNQMSISGEQFIFNLENRTGQLMETYAYLSSTTRYTSDYLKVVKNETIKFKKMDFTACTQCVPRWKITCSNGKIKKDKFIQMNHAWFKIKNIPLFYLPYLRYPLTKDGRSTGFLFPIIGNSSNLGFFIKNAFYWDIKSNLDLTLGIDYYHLAGLALANEFRYLANNIDGNLNIYLFRYRESFLNNEKNQNTWKPSNRYDYLFHIKHIQKVNFLNTKITIDIDKHSDPNFLRFFSDDFERIQKISYPSSMAIGSSLKKLKINLRAAENETYWPTSNKSTITRYLPTIDINLNSQKIWKLPGYFSFTTSYSSISKKMHLYGDEVNQGNEEKYPTDPLSGVAINRLVLKPSYLLPLLKEPWLNASLSFKSTHGFYPKTKDPASKDIIIRIEPLFLHYQTTDFSIKGPVFSKIYNLSNSKIKHVIEPKVVIKYATSLDEDERNRLLTKDDFYYQESSQLNFSLTSRLLFKHNSNSSAKVSSTREILSHTIEQKYYFNPILANKNRTVGEVYPQFSQLSNILRFSPIKNLSLNAAIHYNHYLKRFHYMVFSMNYNNKKSFLNGYFKYSRIIDQYKYQPVDWETINPETENSTVSSFLQENIGGSIHFNKTGFPIKLSCRLDYNLLNKKLTYGSLGLEYNYQCITFSGKLYVIKYVDRYERRFNIGISLGNLGMVRDLLKVNR